MAVDVRTEPSGLLPERSIRLVADWLDRIGRALRDDGGVNLGEVAIVVVREPAIQDLHARYFNDSTPTDVITFPGEVAGESGVLDGDIAICLDVAREQAGDAGHSAEEEIVFLATHGLLHLCGWDDRTPGDRDAMLRRQTQLMNRTAPSTFRASPECE